MKLKDRLILANGKYEGIWSSEELKFARDKGYTIKVVKGYNFNRVKDTFKDFIEDIFEKKKFF